VSRVDFEGVQKLSAPLLVHLLHDAALRAAPGAAAAEKQGQPLDGSAAIGVSRRIYW
jgi:hypothetical protein